jgi:D-3-phosphoglycerate dehydrogenase
MARRFSILIAEPESFSVDAREILERACEVHLEDCCGEALRAAFREHDAIWVRLRERIDDQMLGPAPRCRVLATATTGLDHLDLEGALRRGIRVVSLKGEIDFLRDVRATAELTIGLALALLRKIPAAARSASAGAWNRDLFTGRELYGKTAGIIGLGRLGRIVARYLRAFDMRVVGYDPRPDFPAEVAERMATLEELLDLADLVTIHVALDSETRGLIGTRELARMKPSSVLINTSRGHIVDEVALLDALSSDRISGAALDVLAAEPNVSPADPLLQYAKTHDNLIVVPHIGGKTIESMEKTEIFLATKVVAALEGLA